MPGTTTFKKRFPKLDNRPVSVTMTGKSEKMKINFLKNQSAYFDQIFTNLLTLFQKGGDRGNCVNMQLYVDVQCIYVHIKLLDTVIIYIMPSIVLEVCFKAIVILK